MNLFLSTKTILQSFLEILECLQNLACANIKIMDF